MGTQVHKFQIEIQVNTDPELNADIIARLKYGENWRELSVKKIPGYADPWKTDIEQYLLQKNETTTLQIGTECLRLAGVPRSIQMRIALILRTLGWQRMLLYKAGDKRARVWVKREAMKAPSVVNDTKSGPCTT